MATSLVGALGARFPDTTVLFDDDFQNKPGFHGWQELHTDPSVATSGPTFAPLTLSHPSMAGSCLALTTRSVADQGIHSQCIAMKRLSHRAPLGIVDLEVWFSWGGESSTGFSPRYLQFMVDEMYGGTRHFWQARWRNVNPADTSTRPMNWYLASQSQSNFLDTTLVSDMPWNGNKGSESYVKLTLDLKNSKYLALQANEDHFDLTTVPGLAAPGANGDSTFNDPLFNYGLNFMVGVLNRGDQPYMGWMACSRIRATARTS